MPAVIIGMPPSLAGTPREVPVRCEAATVGAALRRLAEDRPDSASRLYYGERLVVVVTLNGRYLPPAQIDGTGLADGDRIDLFLPVAGG